MSIRADPDELEPITPRDAADRFLDKRDTDSTQETLRSYRDRLYRFVRWCEDRGLLNVNDVDGRDLQDYLSHRQETCNRTTLNNEFGTLKKLFEFLVAIEATEPAMPDKVDLLKPNTTKNEESNDERLSASRAEEILEHLERYEFASRNHVVLRLAWFIGLRRGGLRAIDVGDVSLDGEVREDVLAEMGKTADDVPDGIGPHIYMVHRPSSGTPLKNQSDSERVVSIGPETVEIVEQYIAVNRRDVADDEGREPLITTRQGRPSKTSFTRWMYRLTHPCTIKECPHDKDPETCEALQHGHESNCPSTLSPHRVRTGAITHMREQDMPPKIVAERVDATPETIRKHYDKSDLFKRSEQRRKHLRRLDF